MLAGVDDRYERGLDAFASQLGLDREQVRPWFPRASAGLAVLRSVLDELGDH
jgi:hypothetical protein